MKYKGTRPGLHNCFTIIAIINITFVGNTSSFNHLSTLFWSPVVRLIVLDNVRFWNNNYVGFLMPWFAKVCFWYKSLEIALMFLTLGSFLFQILFYSNQRGLLWSVEFYF